jgi:hypothetical protein
MSDTTQLGKIQEQIMLFDTSSEFEEITAYYSKPNIFRVLHVARSEQQHSWFLAWLFDNNSNHGLGDFPVRKLLATIVYANSTIA